MMRILRGTLLRAIPDVRDPELLLVELICESAALICEGWIIQSPPFDQRSGPHWPRRLLFERFVLTLAICTQKKRLSIAFMFGFCLHCRNPRTHQ